MFPRQLLTAFIGSVAISALAHGNEEAPDSFFAAGEIPSGFVRSVAVQPDGKILIGGSFTGVNGHASKGVARLNVDGTVDTGFTANFSGNVFSVDTLCVQPDGGILAGGKFSTVDGVARGNFVRLTSNGSLDTAFAAGLPGANGEVNAIVLQPDGRILLGGSFTAMHVFGPGRIARLKSDGTLDPGFRSGAGFVAPAGAVAAVALQEDGKILIGGYFRQVDGEDRSYLARLSAADGRLDGSIGGNGGANGNVLALAVQPGGKIIVAGDFSKIAGATRNRIARLNADGSLDLTFGGGSAAADAEISVVFVRREDGKILLGGKFTKINGAERGRIARLDAEGFLDPSFASEGAGANGFVSALAQQPDGKVIAVGDFTSFSGQPRHRLVRLGAAAPRDLFAPEINLLGENPMVVALGSAFSDPGAVVKDNVDADKKIGFSGGFINPAQSGEYTLIYTAADAAGNPAISATRTVVVSPAAPSPTPTPTPTPPPPSEGIRLKITPRVVKLKAGGKRQIAVLVTNNTLQAVSGELEVTADPGLVAAPAKVPFVAPGKRRVTSPPKAKRVVVTLSGSAARKGSVSLSVGFGAVKDSVTVTVK